MWLSLRAVSSMRISTNHNSLGCEQPSRPRRRTITQCTGRVSANARPLQLRGGDRECGCLRHALRLPCTPCTFPSQPFICSQPMGILYSNSTIHVYIYHCEISSDVAVVSAVALVALVQMHLHFFILETIQNLLRPAVHKIVDLRSPSAIVVHRSKQVAPLMAEHPAGVDRQDCHCDWCVVTSSLLVTRHYVKLYHSFVDTAEFRVSDSVAPRTAAVYKF